MTAKALSLHGDYQLSSELLSNPTFGVDPGDDSGIPAGWSLSEKPNWKVTPYRDDDAFVLLVKAADESGPVSYLRQQVAIRPQAGVNGQVRASLNVRVAADKPVNLMVAMFRDADLHDKIIQRSESVKTLGEWTRLSVNFDIGAGESAVAGQTFHVVVNVVLPASSGLVYVKDASLKVSGTVQGWQPKVFRFDTFGDFTKASSRLRAWKIADTLEQMGHTVTINAGSTPDIYVCQKVRPLSEMQRSKAAGARLIYDFDDNYLLASQGTKADLVAMLNIADVVTVGNSKLLGEAKKYHDRVYLFENPVDVLDDTTVRPSRGQLKDVAWFGAPEGRVQLEHIDAVEPITTITAGGDIEFDIYTVDSTLTKFDLCVFPLETTEWNLSKNANRMIKAIALGIPVLATSTPEHEGVARLCGLDERFIVRPGESWTEKIEALRADVDQVETLILSAREAILENYGLMQTCIDWLKCIEPSKNPQRLSELSGDKPSERADIAGDTTLLVLSYAIDNPLRQLLDCQTPLEAFRERRLIGPFLKRDNTIAVGGSLGFEFRAIENDYFEMLDQLDACVADCPSRWLLVVPDGYSLTTGFLHEYETNLANPDAQVVVFNSHAPFRKPDDVNPSRLSLADWILSPINPGVIAVRTDWLQDLNLNARDLLSYWSWAVVSHALAQGVVHFTEAPVAVRSVSRDIANLSTNYKEWVATMRRDLAKDMPSSKAQWLRISEDVLRRFATGMAACLPSAYAKATVDLLQRKPQPTDA